MLPNHLPSQAMEVFINLLLHHDQFQPDITALAVWEIIGYGLYEIFGDVKYPLTSVPEAMALAGIDSTLRQQIRDRFNKLKSLGIGIALLQLLHEYGSTLLKFIEELNKLFQSNQVPTQP